MTEGAPEIQPGQGNESPGFEMNPAWNEALSLIPQTLHSQVAPIFHKWDQGAQEKISEYNNKYSGFEPFVENGVTPDILAGAMHLAESLQTDPRGVYDAIASHYKFEQQVQEAIEDIQDEQDGLSKNDPRFAELENLKQNQQLLANIILKERQEAAERTAQEQADAEFDIALKAVQEKYPDKYNENHLLTIMKGQDLTDPMKAMEVYLQMTGQNGPAPAPAPPYAPNVMGSGGNVPVPLHGNKHPSQLNDDETVSAITSMLKARNAQNRG